MGAGGFDPEAFSGVVPLFPLPDVVLFPHALLPLHIFEPRYRAMTADALGGERLLGMALLKPGWEKDYFGDPDVHEVAGMGRVVQETRHADGRFDVLLHGVARIRILEVVSRRPYRSARVEVLRERPAGGGEHESGRLALIDWYNRMVRAAAPDAPGELPAAMPLGPLCDLLASLLDAAAEVKQALLEELDAGARCDRLMGLLKAAPRPRRAPPSMN